MIYKKQFVIMEQPFDDPDFTHIQLTNGLTLSVHKQLHYESFGNCHLLGTAIQTDKTKKLPIEELAGHCNVENLMDIYKSWSGAWCLIANDEIHLDASSQLPVFYTTCKEKTLISSSLAVLSELTGYKKVIDDRLSIKHERGMDWYPIPLTQLENARQLLPSQILRFDRQKLSVIFRDIFKYKDSLSLSRDEILDNIVNIMREFFRNVGLQYQKIYVPLTGGYDSRTIFTVLSDTGIKFSTYTFYKKQMYQYDLNIPQKLAALRGVPHIVIKPQVKNEVDLRTKEYEIFTYRNASGADKLYYAHNMHINEKNAVVLKGNIWGTAMFFYKKLDNDEKDKLKSIKDAFLIENGSFFDKGIREYLEWVDKNPVNIEWCNRFYWEQRGAAWAGSISQSYGLLDSDYLNIANSIDLLNLLFSLPKEDRKSKLYERDIICRINPVLDQVPYNHDSGLDKIVYFIKRIFKTVRKYRYKITAFRRN